MNVSLQASRLGWGLALCMFIAPRVYGAGPAASSLRSVVPPTPVTPGWPADRQAWEPDYHVLSEAGVTPPGEEAFLQAARDFLTREGVDPQSVRVELAPLGDPAQRIPGHWRALAEVFVNEDPAGQMVKRLVFEPNFWLNPTVERFAHHRWTKIMWHEIHHLQAFPVNLRRGPDLAKAIPPRSKDRAAWEHQWIAFLEPLEEMAAERSCIERYQAAFGPLAPELLRDSQGDMIKYAALYRQRLADLMADARDPQAILREFPPVLPVDSEGNIL